jgi:acyl-ACP thioesterase
VTTGPGDVDHQPLLDQPDVGRVFSTRRLVRMADAAVNGRLRLDGCARYLQDVANDDSRDAGSPNPTAWVARRTVIAVRRFPHYLDLISSSTWCSGVGSRWAERRYSMVGEDGSPGDIQASTLWVHIDMATMRPVPVPAGFAEQFGASALGRVVSARLHLPSRPPDVAPLDRAGWPLRAIDFDVLGHVNNSVYWAIVEEQLAQRRGVRPPFTVTLEHHDPIDPGDAVTVTALDRDGGFDLWITAAAPANEVPKLAAVVRATHDRSAPEPAADLGPQ